MYAKNAQHSEEKRMEMSIFTTSKHIKSDYMKNPLISLRFFFMFFGSFLWGEKFVISSSLKL